MHKEKISELSERLLAAVNTVVFTGAGISTGSGLSDFRGSTGLWKDRDPVQLASVEAMEKECEDFYLFYRERINVIEKARPSEGHKILARWEKENLIRGIISQNVDGLHQKAGSKNVAAIHGSLSRVRCRICDSLFPASVYLTSHICEKCGGRLRPDAVLFGEMLPVESLRLAQNLSEGCDLFIVLGSSLQVSPANWFPMDAKKSGATLVIINMQETPLDEMADIVIPGRIEEVLEQTDELILMQNK